MSNRAHRGLKLLLLSASLILSIALLAAACSGGGDGDGGSKETPAADDTSADDADNAGPVSFDISMGDTIEPEITNFFELNQFTVSPGQEVTFNITNDGGYCGPAGAGAGGADVAAGAAAGSHCGDGLRPATVCG